MRQDFLLRYPGPLVVLLIQQEREAGRECDARTVTAAWALVSTATFAFASTLFCFLFLFLAWGSDPGGFSQFRETHFQKCLQTPQIRRCVHISAESEISRAVVGQDGAVERHLAADRDIGITVQHLVAEQVERILRPRHVGAHHVERRERQPAQDRGRPAPAAESGNMPINPPAKLTNSAACARLRNSVLLWTAASSFSGIANIQRNGDRNQRDAVPQFAGTVAAAQIDRNHHAEQPPLNLVAMQFEVASDGRRHQRENDVIHAGAAGVPDGFDFRQRNFCPGKFLRSAVENVETQPLGGALSSGSRRVNSSVARFPPFAAKRSAMLDTSARAARIRLTKSE